MAFSFTYVDNLNTDPLSNIREEPQSSLVEVVLNQNKRRLYLQLGSELGTPFLAVTTNPIKLVIPIMVSKDGHRTGKRDTVGA